MKILTLGFFVVVLAAAISQNTSEANRGWFSRSAFRLTRLFHRTSATSGARGLMSSGRTAAALRTFRGRQSSLGVFGGYRTVGFQHNDHFLYFEIDIVALEHKTMRIASSVGASHPSNCIYGSVHNTNLKTCRHIPAMYWRLH